MPYPETVLPNVTGSVEGRCHPEGARACNFISRTTLRATEGSLSGRARSSPQEPFTSSSQAEKVLRPALTLCVKAVAERRLPREANACGRFSNAL